MLAQIDGDLITYPCAASCKENDPFDVAKYRMEEKLREILDTVQATEFKIFLSSNNFRKTLFQSYKANRDNLERPKHLEACREYLVYEWNAILKTPYEADDLLGIYQTDETILCSYDKDLRMISGKHYNWNKKIFETVDLQTGLKHFYKQMLIGDSSDNIIGINGIGKVKADKIISPLNTEQEMFDTVYDLYTKHNIQDSFLMNGICLWILRNEEETWAHRLLDLTLPNPLQQQVEAALNSMKYLWDT
jgi:5'-3' exonuclease